MGKGTVAAAAAVEVLVTGDTEVVVGPSAENNSRRKALTFTTINHKQKGNIK